MDLTLSWTLKLTLTVISSMLVAERPPPPPPQPSGFMLVSGGAQLEMETDSDDDNGPGCNGVLTGHVRAGGGPLPSRPEDVMSECLPYHIAFL